MQRIAVFCGASIGFSEDYKHAAQTLGQYLAQHDISMIYGGGKIGMMGAIADTMLPLGGEVIGVIPELLRHEEVAHNKITQMLISKGMSDRKVTISKMVDGYIALAGGYGTLDEIFEALTLGQLHIEQKPVGLLNTNGYFDHLLKQLDHMVEEGFLRQENRTMLLVSDSVPELIELMQNYKAPQVSKLINTTVKKFK
ncbi:MAG: TIGR00730 family Rossman fold protein [Flavobacteriia bacterium]|nr:MAG: TIGR00730 family Rossman fold protein [Flavobacteriia bacterium]